MIQAQITGLKKSFGKNVILKNVGMTINKGEVVCIIGPSGSGKTTFLRCLNLLERPDAGMYELGDLRYDLSRIGSHQSREIARKTAMVFQSYELFSHTHGQCRPVAAALRIVDWDTSRLCPPCPPFPRRKWQLFLPVSWGLSGV